MRLYVVAVDVIHSLQNSIACQFESQPAKCSVRKIEVRNFYLVPGRILYLMCSATTGSQNAENRGVCSHVKHEKPRFYHVDHMRQTSEPFRQTIGTVYYNRSYLDLTYHRWYKPHRWEKWCYMLQFYRQASRTVNLRMKAPICPTNPHQSISRLIGVV